MAEGTELFEIIHTTRAMRRLKPDPVPDELIRKILQAGVCAASGGNAQRWRFLIIKDPVIKKEVQRYYKRAFDEVVGPRYATSAPPPGVTKERYQRQHAAVDRRRQSVGAVGGCRRPPPARPGDRLHRSYAHR